MQVLTPSGYVDIIDLNIGDEVVAYDINTGAVIINHLEGKTLWSPDMYPEEAVEGHYDENGNWVPPVVVKTSYEVFQSIHGDWKYYRINGTWDLFKLQSVWVNMNVVHASDLQIGDIIYNDQDGDVVITSIEEVDIPLTWWKLDVSGDSSYIADDITLHNASRYWVGGGSSSNWNATGNTNWSSTSGGANNASVPTSADVANFDGAGNSSSVISATITIGGLIITSAYTSTITHNFDLTVAGSITLGANYTIAGTAALNISAACTFTSNGKTWSNSLIFSTSTTTTLVGNLVIGGLWTTLGAVSPTVNSTTTETLTCGGGIFFGNNCIPTGTAKHIITGGTLNTNAGYGGFGLPLDIAGNITILSFAVQSKPVNYISGIVTTTGSTFYVGGGSTLNLSGIIFNNFTKGGSTTVGGITTMTSNIVVNGLFSGSGTFNRTGSETITCNGGITANNNAFQGTVELVAKGGTITTGSYTSSIDSDLTIDGNVTFAGNVLYHSGEYGTGRTLKYLSGTTNAASTTLYIKKDSSINTSAISWAALVRSMSFNATTTLISNLNIIGATSILQSGPINTSTSSKLITGGLTLSVAQSGTATIELTGGTWSGAGTLSNNLNINGNITISGSVYYGTGTLTYVSGTPIVTGSSLGLPTSCTMNTSGMTWNNIFHSQINVTLTLTSNLNLNGQLTIAGGQAFSINKTTSEVVNTYGGILANYGNLSGTAPVYVKGGFITNTGGQFGGTLYLDGDITITGNFYIQQATLNYSSGSINTSGCTLQIANHATNTLNTAGMIWETVTTPGNAAATTFVSDFVARNIVLSSNSHTFNTSTGARFIPLNSLTLGNTFPWSGNVTLVLGSNVVANFANSNISTLPITIDGDCTIMNTLNTGANVMTYVKGKVNFMNFIHNVTDNATFRGFGRLPVPRVNITAAKTISMDQFFTGTPQTPANITCSTAAGTYTVVFTDTFERVATNVVTSGCVLSRPIQLIVSSPSRINTIRTTNSGIRFANQSPNGVAKNAPTKTGMFVGVPGGLQSDPCFTKQN